MFPNVFQETRPKSLAAVLFILFQMFPIVVVYFKKQDQKPVDAALYKWFQMFPNVVVYFKKQ